MIKYFCLTMLLLVCTTQAKTKEEKAARNVIKRLIGKELIKTVQFKQIPKVKKCDVFETKASNGILTVRGSSGVAMSRAFYDYIKRNNYGVVSWSGTRLNLPKAWPNSKTHRVESPYQHHYNFNVVTYGYTVPYWDWKRWEKELDWMALHGYDMPLALAGTEAVAIRVWKKLGLPQKAIDEFYVGPAHLPWQRMGNIVNHDGPIPESWHKGQVTLQHKVLKRMRELGMKPITPAFAGFVPKQIKKIYPEVKLHKAGWGGWPAQNHARLLMPDTPLFNKIGKMFIKEWEKEFGKSDFYLADSFNEMEIPASSTKEQRYQMMSNFGESIYNSIKAGNPDATWVMQGWMFGYQRHIWTPETLNALLKDVPDDKMLLLDLAVDYNAHYWRSGYNWDHYKGFYNKQWVYSTVPNMGGKTGFTGFLDFYAKGGSDALKSKNKGRLVGYGTAMEGIENNEVLYELIADMGWQKDPADLDVWIENYCVNRYGAYPAKMKEAWDLMRKSCYGSFTDHPRFNWQFRPGARRGSVNVNATFRRAVEAFAACSQDFSDNKLYQADLIELTSAYIGAKIEDLIHLVPNYETYSEEKRDKAVQQIDDLFVLTDRLLQSHPLHRLDRWLNFAKKHGSNEKEKLYYESNAKRLVTVWGPPIDDYSARVWAGLVGDYYRNRWKNYFASQKSGKGFNFRQWEENWVKKASFNKSKAFKSPLKAALKALKYTAKIEAKPIKIEGNTVAKWTPSNIKGKWTTVDFDLNTSDLKNLKGFIFKYEKGSDRLEMNSVSLVLDGKETKADKHFGYAGLPSNRNFYKVTIPADSTSNNSCKLRVVVRALGQVNSYGRIEAVKSK